MTISNNINKKFFYTSSKLNAPRPVNFLNKNYGVNFIHSHLKVSVVLNSVKSRRDLNRSYFKSFYLGLKKGIMTPTLPDRILLYIKFFLLIIFLTGLGLKFIFNVNDSDNLILMTMYKTFVFIQSHYTIIKYLILIWLWLGLFIFTLEYIKYKFYFDKTINYIPSYLPKFIKNKLNDINEDSKIDNPVLKDIYIDMVTTQLKFASGFTLVMTGIFLYF